MGEAVRNGWLFIFFWRDEVRHPCNREADLECSHFQGLVFRDVRNTI